MPDFDYDLFVIGGGSGGVRAARVAAGPVPKGSVSSSRWARIQMARAWAGVREMGFLGTGDS